MVIMMLVMGFAKNVTILVYNVQVQQKMNASLVLTLYPLNDLLVLRNAFAQINIMMTPKTNYANFVLQHVTPVW